jgi:hypothetical protein
MATRLDNVLAFWEWFDEARGDLSIRQVEERARCPRGRIGNAYSAKKEPSLLVCQSIADGLWVDLENVLYRAGYLKSRRPSRDPYFEVLEALWDRVPDWKKKDLVTQLRAVVEEYEGGAIKKGAQKEEGSQ